MASNSTSRRIFESPPEVQRRQMNEDDAAEEAFGSPSSTNAVAGSDSSDDLPTLKWNSLQEINAGQVNENISHWLSETRHRKLPVISNAPHQFTITEALSSGSRTNSSRTGLHPQHYSTPVKQIHNLYRSLFGNVGGDQSFQQPNTSTSAYVMAKRKSMSSGNLTTKKHFLRNQHLDGQVPLGMSATHLNKRKSISMDTLSLKKRKAGGPPTHLTALTVTNDKLKLLIQNILHILTILNIEDAPTNEREYRAMFGHQFMNLCFEVISKVTSLDIRGIQDERDPHGSIKNSTLIPVLKSWKCPMLLSKLQFLNPMSASYLKTNALLLNWICNRVNLVVTSRNASVLLDNQHEQIAFETVHKLFKDHRDGRGSYNAISFYQGRLLRHMFGKEFARIPTNHELRQEKEKLEKKKECLTLAIQLIQQKEMHRREHVTTRMTRNQSRVKMSARLSNSDW